jgi:hypothetical protein
MAARPRTAAGPARPEYRVEALAKGPRIVRELRPLVADACRDISALLGHSS